MAVCEACQGKGVIVNQSPFSLPSVCLFCRGSGKLKLIVTELTPCDHACFLYWDLAVQLATAVAFTIEGLKQGECCFYVADEHSVEAVKEAFARNGVSVKKQVNNRALNILTKKESYLSSGQFDASEMIDYIKDAIKAATRAGFLAFRGTGEMTWALAGEPGSDQLMTYEALLDRYVEEVRPDMVTLCQYNIRRFPEDKLQSVLQTHKTVVLDAGRVVSNPYYSNGMRRSSSGTIDQRIDTLRKQVSSN